MVWLQELWPTGKSWSKKAMPVDLRSEQNRIAKNEHRRLTHHERKKDTAYYRKDTAKYNKRNQRWYMRKYRPERARELQQIDAERKRQKRSQYSPETIVSERMKDADRKYVERIVSADMDPQHNAYMKKRHAKQEKERRAAKPELIRSTERLNNRMRMRAERKGKTEYDYVDVNKIKVSTSETDTQNLPRRRYRRSPETRKIHAAQERRRIASLSPNTAAKARELKAKREICGISF